MWSVLENTNSSTSSDITDYYVFVRHIPSENICRIACATTEEVTQTECESNIIAPIQAFLRNPAISDHIDYIVLTKGAPLSADYGYSSGPLSITSILKLRRASLT